MLLNLDDQTITQRCDRCGAQHTHPIDDLRAGSELDDGTPVTPNVIGLPVCTDCDTREFLIRVPVRPAHRGGKRDHRRGVNALHHLLVSTGRVPASLGPYFEGEDLEFERASLPWAFEGEPPPPRPSAAADPTEAAFRAFLATRQEGE